MDNTVLLALIGIAEMVITSVVTFLLTRRKYKTEVVGNEIDNKHKDLAFYIDLANDNKQKLDELQSENKELRDENRELRKEMAEMRSVVFGMLQQVCTDMMCQSRKFDQAQCPYYGSLFNYKNEENVDDVK